MKYTIDKKEKKMLAFIGILLLILLISLFFDQSISDFFSETRNSFISLLLMWSESVFFGGVILILLIITTMLHHVRNYYKNIPPMWISFILTFVVTVFLKFIVGRSRPVDFDMLNGFFSYSFPSLHVALCFSVVPFINEKLIFWILFGILIGAARIYLNVHYLSDVIAGIALGVFIGYIVEKRKFA